MDYASGNTVGVRTGARPAERDFWNPVPDTRYDLPVESPELDFWLPPALRQAKVGDAARVEQQRPSQTVDFWSSVAAEDQLSDDVAPARDWGSDGSLPWYDPDLGENPYVVIVEPPSPLSMAARRGRWLSQLLDVPQPKRREMFAQFFGELFEQFPSQQTFRALSDLAIGSIDPEAMRSGCSFRMAFLNSPKLASRRSARTKVPTAYHEPEAMLSWRRAVRLSEACGGDDPSDFIQDDWYLEWIELEVGHPLYWSYLDYLECRLRVNSSGYWDLAPKRSAGATGLDETTKRDLTRLVSYSRTAGLARGQTDIIGVAYPEPHTPHIVPRSSRGRTGARPELLD
jgi:hypothetical protein